MKKRLIKFNEEDLQPIKDHLKKKGNVKEYGGKVTNQSAIDEAIIIATKVVNKK